MSYRSAAVRAAVRELDRYPNGRPELYYRETGGASGTDWCGMFVLRSLQQAGLAKGVRWVQGRGFIDPLRLTTIATPLPGDIAYVPDPFQHEALVVSFEPATGMVTTIDGNQPGIKPRVRFLKNGNLTFYSIEPLVKLAESQESILPYLAAGALVAGAVAFAWNAR